MYKFACKNCKGCCLNRFVGVKDLKPVNPQKVPYANENYYCPYFKDGIGCMLNEKNRNWACYSYPIICSNGKFSIDRRCRSARKFINDFILNKNDARKFYSEVVGRYFLLGKEEKKELAKYCVKHNKRNWYFNDLLTNLIK